MTTQPQMTPKPLRILIVEDESLVGMILRQQLDRMGHTVLGQASNAEEAVELYRRHNPDLVFMDIRLAGSDGLEVAKTLLDERPCPVIVISAYTDRELIDRAAAVGVFGYLVKPVDERELEAQIAVALRRFADQRAMTMEVVRLERDLETRKLLDRAKGILMKRAKLTEDDAHRRLLQESQKRRIPLAQLCKTIIESDQVMGA
ncbi:MAG: ANTAR domain-containing response regulator [Tepidisphaerales bacterium]